MKKAQIDLTVFANEDFPLQVQCKDDLRSGKAIIFRAPASISDLANTEYIHYLGWVLLSGGGIMVGSWNKFGSGSSHLHTIPIIKIGWEPDFDWSQVPEAVRFIGKSGSATDIVILSDSRLEYKNDLWFNRSGSDYAMPAKWLGLEDWEGGPDAILERA